MRGIPPKPAALTAALYITADGLPAVEPPDRTSALHRAFAASPAEGLLHLAGPALTATLEPGLAYARTFARGYLVRLCRLPGDSAGEVTVPAPGAEELAGHAMQAPPM